MEIALWWLIVYIAAKGSIKDLIDLPFALRGRTPPGHQYRMAKLNQRAAHGGKAVPRSAPGRYFSGLINDAVDQAHAKRSARHGVKQPWKAKRAADRTKTKLDRKDKRREDRQAKKTAGPDQGDPDTPTAEDQSEMGSFPETDRTDPGAPRPVPVVVPRRTAPDRTEPESDTSIPGTEPATEAVVHQLPVQPQTPTGEVYSLSQAIAHCELMEQVLRATCARMEAVYDTLYSLYKVDGPAIEALGTCWSQTDAAANEAKAAGDELRTRLATKDAYSTVEGPAGSQEFLRDQAG